MGILAELYVASDDQQALKYDASPDIFAHRRQYQRFTALELSNLWAIMQGTEWDVVLMDAFPALLVVDGGERLVHRLPEPMIEALAKMTKEEILTSSEKWASTARSPDPNGPRTFQFETKRNMPPVKVTLLPLISTALARTPRRHSARCSGNKAESIP